MSDLERSRLNGKTGTATGSRSHPQASRPVRHTSDIPARRRPADMIHAGPAPALSGGFVDSFLIVGVDALCSPSSTLRSTAHRPLDGWRTGVVTCEPNASQ